MKPRKNIGISKTSTTNAGNKDNIFWKGESFILFKNNRRYYYGCSSR